jgi:hypothetical protein
MYFDEIVLYPGTLKFAAGHTEFFNFIVIKKYLSMTTNGILFFMSSLDKFR